jgi:GTP-binding protein
VTPPRWVLVGRPNVGKSTLFNRLVGKRHALVADAPGTTRDWKDAPVDTDDGPLILTDTPGIIDGDGALLAAELRSVTERAVGKADAALFVMDGTAGITPDDETTARWLRKHGKPVLVVVTKADRKGAAHAESEAARLGFGEAFAVSGREGIGIHDLRMAMMARTPPLAAETASGKAPISLALVGRPNVGKSSLINALIGEERVLTGPLSGLTRDAIRVRWEHHGTAYQLVDTAGLRRKANVTEAAEQAAASDTRQAIVLASVCILVVDASAQMDKQDFTIGATIADEGRAIVIALNKWDTLTQKQQPEVLKTLRQQVDHALPQCRGVDIIPVSAVKKRGLDDLLKAVTAAQKRWATRIPTHKLNSWLEAALHHHPEPMVKGRRVRLRYATQVKSKPPTIALFTSRPDALPGHYVRYLENSLREAFDLPGVPIRMVLRKSENPYVD